MPALSASAEQKDMPVLAARQVRPLIVSPATARLTELAHVDQTSTGVLVWRGDAMLFRKYQFSDRCMSLSSAVPSMATSAAIRVCAQMTKAT